MNMKKGKSTVAILLTLAFIVVSCCSDSSMNYIKAQMTKNVVLSVENVASWSDSTNEYDQFNVILANTGEESAQDWTFSMSFGENAELVNGWCGSYELENGKLTVTSLSYNNEISSGGEVTFGFILKNAGTFDVNEASVTFAGDEELVATEEPSATPAVSYEPVDFSSLPTVSYKNKDLDASYSMENSETVTYSEDSVTSTGSNVSLDGTTATILAGGTYVISGTCADGCLIVDSQDENLVHIVMDNIQLTSMESAAIFIKSADKTVITLADGTENSVADAKEYQNEDSIEEEPSAAIYSKDDLTFNGTGSLTVTGNYNNAIQCKDKLKFVNGSYDITSKDDGIVGKDCVGIKDGNYVIKAGGDGIKSTNEEDEKGFVEILNGTVTINAGNDGIQGKNDVVLYDGTYEITTNGGYENGVQHQEDMFGGMPGDGMVPSGMPSGGPGIRPSGMPSSLPETSAEPSGTTEPSSLPETSAEPSGTTEPSSLPEVSVAPSGTTEPSTMPSSLPEASVAPSDTTEISTMPTATADTTTEDESAKGIKAGVAIAVYGGTYQFNCADDGIHSDNSIAINGTSSITIATGDDGVHANNALTVDTKSLTITTCYEGLEGLDIAVNGGDISIIASDDGVNASDGTGSEMEMGGDKPENMDSSSMPPMGSDLPSWTPASTDSASMSPMPTDTEFSSMPPMPTDTEFSSMSPMPTDTEFSSMPPMPTDTEFSSMPPMSGGMGMISSGNATLSITGGNLTVKANGDGLDANGSIEMTGGNVIVNGSSNGGNGALDYDTTFNISGGTIIAAGNQRMAQASSDTSTQASILMNYEETQSSNQVFCLKDSDGNVIAAFNPSEDYDSVFISTPDLNTDGTYSIYTGTTQETESRFLEESQYNLGDIVATVQMTGVVTKINGDLSENMPF